MVEVFKTNIDNELLANAVLYELTLYMPHSKINFDLEDCDSILRIENNKVNLDLVIGIVNNKGCYCEPLP
ncbi:MAG: hypothetical protein KDC97_12365 [Confluentibacter sp.]|jgi:hypothetical protein|nr:hypothetical protein [Confluentibacter sp.]